jgi:hypothetical protein
VHTEAGRQHPPPATLLLAAIKPRGRGAGRSRSHEGVTWRRRPLSRGGHRRRRRRVHVDASPHRRRNLHPPPPCRAAKRVAAGSRLSASGVPAAEAGDDTPDGGILVSASVRAFCFGLHLVGNRQRPVPNGTMAPKFPDKITYKQAKTGERQGASGVVVS